MIYILTLCLGMSLGWCNHYRQFEFPTLAECEKERAQISQEAIGKGYAVCEPREKKGNP